MNFRHQASALVISLLASAGVYAQNTTPGTSSPSESGQKPEGVAATAPDSSSGMKSHPMMKSKRAPKSGMSASGSGSDDPNASATQNGRMKSMNKMTSKPAGNNGKTDKSGGDTPVKQ